jgi:hypothetical protein
VGAAATYDDAGNARPFCKELFADTRVPYGQGLSLVSNSAQLEPFLTQNTP